MKKNISTLNNEKGIAVIEMIPILVIVVLMLNFTLGFFGAIHTGILQSTASRNYAFETFRHRTSLYYLRENGVTSGQDLQEKLTLNPNGTFSGERGARIHAIRGSLDQTAQWYATGRNIAYVKSFNLMNVDVTPTTGSGNTNASFHNSQNNDSVKSNLNDQGSSNADLKKTLTMIWVRPQYGICFNAKCGLE